MKTLIFHLSTGRKSNSMDHSIRLKTPEEIAKDQQRARILANFKKATEKWSGKTFSHFATIEEWRAHREQVAKAQAEGAKF
jgi:hypothetical protein